MHLNILKILCRSTDKGIKAELERQRDNIISEMREIAEDISVIKKYFINLISQSDLHEYSNDELKELKIPFHGDFFCSFYSMARNPQTKDIIIRLLKDYDTLKKQLEDLEI